MRPLCILLLSVAVVHAASITGKVVAVTDGDTITVLTTANESVKVRLHGIDAPESKQAFGQRAKAELSSLVFGKDVTVQGENKDRYGRTVGRVLLGKDPEVTIDVNLEMLRRGFAWYYRRYAPKLTEYGRAESEAKAAKVGLWSEPNPVPPWDFRRNESKAKKPALSAVTEQSGNRALSP